jgi:starvation-inducible DNA-binding protein
MANTAICNNLAKTLADEYTLTLKTQNFHWNVEGPMFYALHLMFEQQYTAMQLSVDLVAERIRALGQRSPGSYEEFKKISKVHDAPADKISAHQMIEMLVEDHETLLKDIHQFRKMADQAGDATTATLYDELALFHDKAAWMIRSQRS